MWRNAANGPITLQYMPTLWSGTSYRQYIYCKWAIHEERVNFVRPKKSSDGRAIFSHGLLHTFFLYILLHTFFLYMPESRHSWKSRGLREEGWPENYCSSSYVEIRWDATYQNPPPADFLWYGRIVRHENTMYYYAARLVSIGTHVPISRRTDIDHVYFSRVTTRVTWLASKSIFN